MNFFIAKRTSMNRDLLGSFFNATKNSILGAVGLRGLPLLNIFKRFSLDFRKLLIKTRILNFQIIVV